MADVKIFPDAESLAAGAAEHLILIAHKAILADEVCAVALSGGSTPQRLYSLLAAEDYRTRLDWGHIHLFWGDERLVPPEHLDSNYRMAREALLEKIEMDPANVHRIHGELEAERAAAGYEQELREFFLSHPAKCSIEEGISLPRFDLILLGLGEDGHTASLFPGSVVLNIKTRWAIPVYAPAMASWRISLTPSIINSAAYVTFVVSGKSKANTIRRVLRGPYQPDILPSQIIKPTIGHLLWLVDAEAAAQLEP